MHKARDVPLAPSPHPADAAPVTPAPQNPSRSLETALAEMSWVIESGTFALVGVDTAPTPEDLSLLEPPGQLVVEKGETSLLIRESGLPDLLARHPNARVESGLLWVRFTAPMGWEVVGFLALVTGRLASVGIPLGAVCGYSRDHLFVDQRHGPQLREALAGICPEDGISAAAKD